MCESIYKITVIVYNHKIKTIVKIIIDLAKYKIINMGGCMNQSKNIPVIHRNPSPQKKSWFSKCM